MKFRRKIQYVEAYQIAPDDDRTHRLPPPWFVDLILQNKIEWNPAGGVILHVCEGVTSPVPVGSWVIMDGESVFSLPDSTFQEQFERA